MAFSRALSVIGIVSVSWLTAVGCGDDDSNTQQPGAAGEGGEGGSGGSSVAGSTSVGGEAGGGTGGTAGDAGGGAGGQPVVGGAGAGAGGEPPVTPVGGAAGEGGAGGAGGEPPVAVTLKICSNECEVDEDCVVANASEQMVCDSTSKRCVLSSDPYCTQANDCFPLANFWTPCVTVGDCDDAEAQACITWQGKGYCAYRDIDGCFLPGETSQTLGEFGKVDSPVAVCVAPGGCRLGKCEPGCEANGCEESGYGSTCGTTSHLCECATNTDCEASGVCGANNLCAECQTSEDCPGGLTGLDTCVDGRCGCSGAAVCPDITAAATPVCE